MEERWRVNCFDLPDLIIMAQDNSVGPLMFNDTDLVASDTDQVHSASPSRTRPKPRAVANLQFSREALAFLRCSVDGGKVAVVEEERGSPEGILDGILRCTVCGIEYRIEDGIARMLAVPPTREGEHEITIRDTVDYECENPSRFIPPPDGAWRSVLSDMLEIPQHMEELRPTQSSTVLELACGDGRFTSLIARTGSLVLAVDFSINALRLQAHRLPPGSRVGRVHADINHFHVASHSFDRVLSATPLHSRDERMVMYRTIANALTDNGRFVGGVEYDDLHRRCFGLPLIRRYSREGILVEHLTKQTMRREIAPFFLKVRMYPIRPRLPFIHKLPRKLAYVILYSASVLPGACHFGEILLICAEIPFRIPSEGQHRSGNKVAKGIYRWYMNKKGRHPLWGEELVQ